MLFLMQILERQDSSVDRNCTVIQLHFFPNQLLDRGDNMKNLCLAFAQGPLTNAWPIHKKQAGQAVDYKICHNS